MGDRSLCWVRWWYLWLGVHLLRNLFEWSGMLAILRLWLGWWVFVSPSGFENVLGFGSFKSVFAARLSSNFSRNEICRPRTHTYNSGWVKCVVLRLLWSWAHLWSISKYRADWSGRHHEGAEGFKLMHVFFHEAATGQRKLDRDLAFVTLDCIDGADVLNLLSRARISFLYVQKTRFINFTVVVERGCAVSHYN